MRRRTPPIAPAVLRHAAAVIKCLGHPLRLRLLEAMESGECTVSGLQAHTGAGQATVSEQLGILRGHGVVEARRDGPFVYYRIIEPKVRRILACIRDCDAAPTGGQREADTDSRGRDGRHRHGQPADAAVSPRDR